MANFEELDKMLQNAIDKFPKFKTQLVQKAGNLMEQKVKENLSQHKDTGTTLAAVTKVIGSGGGYVAIRNAYEKCNTAHLLENGHEIKTERKTKKKRKSSKKIKSKKNYNEIKSFGGDFVPGYHCYRNALLSVQDEIIKEAEQMSKKLVGEVFDKNK